MSRDISSPMGQRLGKGHGVTAMAPRVCRMYHIAFQESSLSFRLRALQMSCVMVPMGQ